MKSEGINRRDAYGNLHGYWEWRFNLSLAKVLIVKGCYNHSIQYGYWERSNNDVLTTIEYYI